MRWMKKHLCVWLVTWTTSRNCLRKEITYLLLLILFLMTFCSLIFWYNWWTSTMVTVLPVWSYAICFYWWWYLSVKHPFRRGVLQGSVLVPILHLLYTSLLSDIKKKLKLSFHCYHTSTCPSSQLYLMIGI